MIMSILIYFQMARVEKLARRLFSSNIEWMSYQQQQFAKLESGKCNPKSKVLVNLQNLNDVDR